MNITRRSLLKALGAAGAAMGLAKAAPAKETKETKGLREAPYTPNRDYAVGCYDVTLRAASDIRVGDIVGVGAAENAIPALELPAPVTVYGAALTNAKRGEPVDVRVSGPCSVVQWAENCDVGEALALVTARDSFIAISTSPKGSRSATMHGHGVTLWK